MGRFHFTEVQVDYPQPFPHREMGCIVIGDEVSDAGSVFSQSHAVWALLPSCAARQMICSVTFPGTEVRLTGLKLGLIQDLNLRPLVPCGTIILLDQQADMDILICMDISLLLSLLNIGK